MTKEKIFEVIEKHLAVKYEYNGYYWQMDSDALSNEFIALIEQEKKATIKLILLGFQCALDEKQPERAVEETILRIAERYGVEL
jgi:hypothetical protein